jgi:hypothetical protein
MKLSYDHLPNNINNFMVDIFFMVLYMKIEMCR